MLVDQEELCEGLTGWRLNVAYFCLTDKLQSLSVEMLRPLHILGLMHSLFISNYWRFIDRKSLPMWDFNL